MIWPPSNRLEVKGIPEHRIHLKASTAIIWGFLLFMLLCQPSDMNILYMPTFNVWQGKKNSFLTLYFIFFLYLIALLTHSFCYLITLAKFIIVFPGWFLQHFTLVLLLNDLFPYNFLVLIPKRLLFTELIFCSQATAQFPHQLLNWLVLSPLGDSWGDEKPCCWIFLRQFVLVRNASMVNEVLDIPNMI